VLIYCNTGNLSTQAGFALLVAGYENVKILQGGFEEWKAKGGLNANAKASGGSGQALVLPELHGEIVFNAAWVLNKKPVAAEPLPLFPTPMREKPR
jgi:hypothetical protein